MKRSLVSREIRRVAFLHLSLGVQGLTACGGNASLGPGAGPGAADASLDAVAATDGPSCSVTSQTPSGGGPGSCDLYDFNFSGSVALCGADDAGNLPQARCFELCPPNPGAAADASTPKLSCNLSDGTGLLPAQLECFYDVYCGTGRKPAGLLPYRRRRAGHEQPATFFLARMAYLEAASVDAFERLERELAAHGAPRALRSRVRRAARDEVRHARVVTAFAERGGARVPSPRVRRGRVRSLEAIAIENAVEGCVRETFGAALAIVQSERARSPALRAAMRRIAHDEVRHAELAWAVAGWLDARLGCRARARVTQARTRAAAALVRSPAQPAAPTLLAELGLPGRDMARAIAADLSSGLWDR